MKSLLIAVLAATGLATCACGSLGGAAAPQVTGPAPAASVATVPHRHHHREHHRQPAAVTAASQGPSSGPAGSAASAPAAPPPPAPCLTRYLGASAGIGQGTPGSSYVVIDFKNLNNYPCTLYGYPGVSLAGGKPVTQIGQAATENPATPRQLVTLAPGSVANALLQIVHAAGYPAQKCAPVTAHWLQIYPPNQSVPIYLHYTAQACAKPVRLLAVNVVVPGSGG
jgi:Domain of unknown function (DUF4232)